MGLQTRISGRAELDLSLQYGWYIDHAGLSVAERYLVAFDEMVTRLSEHPGLGMTRKFRAPELAGMRSIPIRSPFGVHLIFYRVDNDTLNIERVMHGARDLPRRLIEPPGI
jgi:toxin ParE1/3/4